jgi:hypothetical protein
MLNTTSMSLFRFISITVLVFTLIGCAQQHEGTLRNVKIDPKVKNVITKLNAIVIDALKNKDEKKLTSLMTADLRASVSENLTPFLEQTSSIIQSKSFEAMDEYHTIKPLADNDVTLISGNDADNDYIIQYHSHSKESFVSVLVPKRDGDRYLVSTFYIRVQDEWKLNTLQFGRHTISGFTAPELFRAAEKEQFDGHLIPAINCMVLSNTCMTPAESNWQYRIASEMDAFNQSLTEQAQNMYPMPLIINEIETQPEIFKIMPQRVDNVICTMIKYRSDINIKDTLALAAENKAMHDMASNLFPGIDDDVPFVFYRAFNEIPKEDISTPYFGFVRPVKENFPVTGK